MPIRPRASSSSMPKILAAALKLFDIARLQEQCNRRECSATPCQCVTIYEYTLNRPRDIITVYLCDAHAAQMRGVLKSLRECAPKMILEKRAKPLGR